MKYYIGEKEFNTKKDAKDFIKNLLKNYYIGEYIFPEHEIILRNLLKNHIDYDVINDTYWGISLEKFKFKTVMSHNTKCFAVEELGEPEIYHEFSYNKCFGRFNHNAEVKNVLRYLIKPQIIEFRNSHIENGLICCDITKQLLPIKKIHVDHHFEKMKFCKIVELWLNKEKITLDILKIINLSQQEKKLEDFYSKSWINFHKETAILRCISAKINQNN